MSNLPKAIKILKITIALGIIGYFLISQSGKLISDQNVRASGDLLVSFEGEPPLFNESNFMPGDSVTKSVDVENTGSKTEMVAVRANNIIGSESTPILPEVLELKITEGSDVPYSGTLKGFFDKDYLVLSPLAPRSSTRYDFTVTMPSWVGNYYKGERVQGANVTFDLIFGCECEEPPTGGCGWNITAQNIGNGPGSVNTILINISRKFSLVQSNSGSVNNDVDVNINTGSNSGGSVNSGLISTVVKIRNELNKNIARWWRR